MPLNRRQINKSLPIPIYFQVASDLRNRIVNHEWQIGDKLPSEAELSLEYKVSRVTIRLSLKELLDDGVIESKQGKGNFLIHNPEPIKNQFLLPSANNAAYIDILTKEVLSTSIESNRPDVNKLLNLESDIQLAYIVRLFNLYRKPIAINKSWISTDLASNLLSEPLIENKLSRTLKEKYNLESVRVNNTIEAVFPTPEEMDILKIKFLVPSILVSTLSYLEDDKPLEYSETTWLGNSVQFNINNP